MTSLEGAGPKQQGIGRDHVHSSSVPSEDKWVMDMEFRIYRESKSLMLNNVMSFLFSLFFHCGIVDLQCCANFCIIAKWLSLADIFFFTFFASMVYPRTLNTVPCALQEDLLSIHSLYKQFASANPKLPVHPSPNPAVPWQPKVCALCLWVCFCFVDRFICLF